MADGATAPIYYESRLAKLELKDSEKPKIDPNFEEATEGEEVDRKEKLKSPLDWQPHIRNKPRREDLAQRFRDPVDPFRIVIVRDMWLTALDQAEAAGLKKPDISILSDQFLAEVRGMPQRNLASNFFRNC